MDNKYKVYLHICPNGKKYCGITGQNPDRRWQNGAGYKGYYFGNAVEKYGWENIDHIILHENLTLKEAENIEIQIIKALNLNNRDCGYNIASGGNLAFNHDLKIGSKNGRARKIKQIDKDTGKTIKIYNCLMDASRELSVNYRGISKACTGNAKSYMGFIWEYNEPFEKITKYPMGKHPNHYKRKAALLDDSGEIIETFDSIKEAADKHQCNKQSINKCCIGLLKTYLGKRWSYLESIETIR